MILKSLFAVPCALALLACARGAPPPPPPADSTTVDASPAPSPSSAGADSLRGPVDVVGSEPGTWTVVRTPAGDVALEGVDRRLLERLAGLEVTVWGRRQGMRFAVERFAVRAADGVAAVDGTLAREGDGWVLVTSDGGRRLPVPHLPQALRGREGARVWLSGPLDRAPDSSGIISEPR